MQEIYIYIQNSTYFLSSWAFLCAHVFVCKGFDFHSGLKIKTAKIDTFDRDHDSDNYRDYNTDNNVRIRILLKKMVTINPGLKHVITAAGFEVFEKCCGS